MASSSLNHVDPSAYIGTATKSIGDKLVALEVTIFPPSLKGTGEGHYAWDWIPDRTLSGVGTTPSAMTNGTISTVSGPTTVNGTMTNGTVSSTSGSGGAKQIVVTYRGGKQVILVPPTAPIVTYQLGERAELKPGAAVFINAVSHGGSGNRECRGRRNPRCEAARVRESLLPVRSLSDLLSRKLFEKAP